MKYLKLSEICNPKQWKTLSTEQLLDKGFPVYGANGKIGYYSTYNHELPTIMITCRGATCGSINISEPKSWINGNAMCLDNLSSDVSLKYLAFYLQNYNFNHVISGSAQPQITREGLEKVKVKVYAKELQEKISIQLDKVQKIISESKAILEKYDTLIKSRFIEMFGNEIVESGKWKVEKLEDVCDLITDGTHKTPNYQQKGIRFISAKNIINGKIDLTDTKFITEEEYKQIQKRCRVEKNDVLLTKSGSLGSSAIIDFDIPIGLFESLAVIKYKRNLLNGIFVKELLSAESSQKQFNNGVKGIAIKHLHLNVIAALKIPIPPIKLQNDFATFVQQIDKSKFEIANSLKRLYNKGMLS